MGVDTRLGDCLEVLKEVPADSATLVYLDPPFFTQKSHRLTNKSRTKSFEFDDTWESREEYAEFLRLRLWECLRVLSPKGSLFFHCDRQAAHVARLVLEDVFGESNFQSEIIWYYRRWSNSSRGLLPAHQNIYFFSKGKDFKFNAQFQAYSASTNVDQILQKRERDTDGKSRYRRGPDGEVISGGGKKGVPLGDVWDIPYLNPKAKERVGYPTQKPIVLLERIIKLVTDPGDLVIDPFCGSGTTLVAAQFLGRNGLGIDRSKDAVELAKQRLSDPVRTSSNLLKVGRDAYCSADEKLLAQLAELSFAPVHRNKGIDAILADSFEGAPVTIRFQRRGESILEAAAALEKASKTKQALRKILVAFGDRSGFVAPAGMLS